MTTRRGFIYQITKPVQPVRPLTGCDTCDIGCDCEGGIEGIGCEHWSCWGRAATNSCHIGVEPLRAHLHASIDYHNRLHAYYRDGGR